MQISLEKTSEPLHSLVSNVNREEYIMDAESKMFSRVRDVGHITEDVYSQAAYISSYNIFVIPIGGRKTLRSPRVMSSG